MNSVNSILALIFLLFLILAVFSLLGMQFFGGQFRLVLNGSEFSGQRLTGILLDLALDKNLKLDKATQMIQNPNKILILLFRRF